MEHKTGLNHNLARQNVKGGLYSCGTSSLTLREQHRLRVFTNRVLREIYGPMRKEERWDQRKLHNEELHGL